MISFLYPYYHKYGVKLILVAAAHALAGLFTVFSIPVIFMFLQAFFHPSGLEMPSRQSNAFETWMQHLIHDSFGFSQLSQTQYIYLVSAFTLVVFFGKNIFRYLAMYFMTPIRTSVVHDIRQNMFEKIQKFSYKDFRNFNSTDLLSRMSNDVTDIEWALISSTEALWKAPIIIIGSLFIMATIQIDLLLFSFLILVVMVAVMTPTSRLLKKPSTRVQDLQGRLLQMTEEMLYGFRSMKLYNAAEWHLNRFKRINDAFQKEQSKLWQRKDLSSPVSEFLGIVGVVALLLYGGRQVVNGELSAEVFFTFIYSFYNIIDPIKSLSNSVFALTKANGAQHRIETVLLAPEEKLNAKPLSKTTLFRKSIQLQDVSFQYEGSQEILKDINLSIAKNSTIAIHGKSGEGKSTLIDLIVGLRKPTKGNLTVDHVGYGSLSVEDLRALFSVIDQNITLFSETISENIKYSSVRNDHALDASDKRFINKVEKQLSDKQLDATRWASEKSNALSGGEKQKLALARAVMHGGEVLILDEATSNIDSEAEAEIIEYLKHMKGRKTIVIISHKGRLSTLADVHYLLDAGTLSQIDKPLF